MLELVLTVTTANDTEEIIVDGDKVSFGRGSDADYRFDDNGLSRLHATIYREGDDIWVVDENSTNGTFLNDEKVSIDGIPIKDGDILRIGHQTDIEISIREKSAAQAASASSSASTQTVSSSEAPKEKSSLLIPLAVTALALLIVGASVVFISVLVLGNNGTEIAQKQNEDDPENIFTEFPDEENGQNTTESQTTEGNPTGNPTSGSPTSTTTNTPSQIPSNNENIALTNSPTAKPDENTVKAPTGKKYLQMSDAEKRQYIEAKASRVARMIGNLSTSKIPPLAIDRIKGFTDAYAKRINVSPRGGCRFGDNLQVTYERASKNAPFINRAFKQYGLDPQIGLYLAMIESEHCVCLQSPTGPLGMFQFTRATGRRYGLSIRRDASPTNGDERCEPRPAAIAAAKYMKFLTGRYGTGPSSVPLAIGSYNSGEGGLSRNLKTALESNEGLPRDFWTLIANGEKLSKQFQSENFKYVPKFFAAAIVGENPRDFGMNLRPLSTYSKE